MRSAVQRAEKAEDFNAKIAKRSAKEEKESEVGELAGNERRVTGK
jgi:hypothetical protein